MSRARVRKRKMDVLERIPYLNSRERIIIFKLETNRL